MTAMPTGINITNN